MKEEKSHKTSTHAGTVQQKNRGMALEDNRNVPLNRLTESIQREVEEDEEESIQGKFSSGKEKSVTNTTGIPDDVKNKMEDSFHRDFSHVKIHTDSAAAIDVGALAYTQGTDIYFAPGQFRPATLPGQEILGHELAHVIQQTEGRVHPTTEINGMPVNDDQALEKEADKSGYKAARK